MEEQLVFILIGIVLAILYMIIGFGVARMTAKINDRDVRLIDVCFWWVSVLVFATIGKVQ